MTNELEPCPFCGSDSAPVLSDCVEIEACVCFEDCKDGLAKCVVCDIHKGGCGASGGFAYSEEEAIKRWNARPNCGAEVVDGD